MIAQICSNDAVYHLLCEPLSYPFMQNALLAMLMLGCVAGTIGAYVVVRGMAFMTDALGHAILPGVAIAYLSGGGDGPLFLGAAIVGSITSVGIGFFSRGRKVREDNRVCLVFSWAPGLWLALL